MADNRNDIQASASGFATSLDDTQRVAISNASEAYRIAMGRITPDKQVVVCGDSQTVYYMSQVTREMDYLNCIAGNRNIKFSKCGVSGTTLSAIDSGYATNIAPYYDGTLTTNYLVIWAGTNDISAGASLVAMQTSLQSIVTKAEATGFTCIIMQSMARDFSGDVTKTVKISDFNIWLRAQVPTTFATALVGIPTQYFQPETDYGSQAAYIADNDSKSTDATYYIDGTHLVESLSANSYKGYSEFSPLVLSEITL